MQNCNCWVSTASHKGAVYPWDRMGGHITAFLKIKTFLHAGKGKQAFMVIEFYPFGSLTLTVKEEAKKGPSRVEVLEVGKERGRLGGGCPVSPVWGPQSLFP